EAGDRSMTPPGSMSEAYDIEEHNASDGITQMAAYEAWATVGATGSRTASVSWWYTGGAASLIALTPTNPAPVLTGVSGDCSDLSRVIVTFDRDLESVSAQSVGNYSVTSPSGVVQTITSAVRSPNN